MTAFKVLASRAQSVSWYENLKTKVTKCCANIYFSPLGSQMCTVTLYILNMVLKVA